MRDPASSRDPLAEARRAQLLARAFTVLIVLTLGLIVLGALVRAHGAGLACPDWPRCFGVWVPVLDLRIGFEWAHRAMAGSISLLFAGLGLGILPCLVGSRHPGLRCLSGSEAVLTREIWLVLPRELRDVPRVRVVGDWLVERFHRDEARFSRTA